MSIKLQERGGTFSIYVPSTVQPRPVLRATGYANKETAKKVATMVASLRDRGQFVLLNAVVEGKTTLFDLYQAQVQNKLDEMKEQIDRVEIEPFLEPWLKVRVSKGLSPASVRLYRQRMKKLLFEPVGAEPVRFADELNEGRIDNLLANLGITSGTTRQYLHEVTSFCRYLVSQGVLARNPAANRELIESPAKNTARRRWVREDVSQALVEAADPIYRGALAGAHGSSADRGDLPRLRRRDLNLQQAYVDIDGNKKGAKRRRMAVPIERWALPYLLAACEGKEPDDLLFADLSLDAITRAHERAAAAIGLDDYWLRDGRHSYAIRAILRGAPIADVSEWMGHSSLATTYNTYVHFDGEVKRILKAGSGVRGTTASSSASAQPTDSSRRSRPGSKRGKGAGRPADE